MFGLECSVKLFFILLFKSTLYYSSLAKYAIYSSSNLNAFLHTGSNYKLSNGDSHLVVSIHVNPSFVTDDIQQFLIVDEAYQPLKGVKERIMSPYLIEINREDPILMYPLQFVRTVSGQNNMKTLHKKNLGVDRRSCSFHTPNDDQSNQDDVKNRPNGILTKEIKLNMDNRFANAVESDVVACDTCGGKNKTGKKTTFIACSNHPNVNNLKKVIINNYGTETKSYNPGPFLDLPKEDTETVPCNTCGGKNKKPGGKPGIESCGCVSNHALCTCNTRKFSRSKRNQTGPIPIEPFSIYNISNPLPYLSTKVRIFRKRRNAWWRIVPPTTLNTLSGIVANENLSVVLSSQVHPLQLEKSVCFQNHQLMVPNTKLPGDSNLKDIFLSAITEPSNDKNTAYQQNHMLSIANLDSSDSKKNSLRQCPNNKDLLCLNIVDDRTSAYSMKIKIPFVENTVLKQNIKKVKIARIIADATTKDTLLITLDVINKGIEKHEFFIDVSQCPVSHNSGTETIVERLLLPNIGETVTFLMPYLMGSKRNEKYTCEIFVKSRTSDTAKKTDGLKNKRADKMNKDFVIVARRLLDVQSYSRCFCIWKCRCHCLEKLETHVDFNVCQKLSYSSEKAAGLLLNCPPANDLEDECLLDIEKGPVKNSQCGTVCTLLRLLLLLILILLLLGICKAIFGICYETINRFGFDTVQPGGIYECSSSTRKFVVNVFFFILWPFVSWCKCFTPRKEDLLAASMEWYCTPEEKSCDCEEKAEKKSSTCRLPGGLEIPCVNLPNSSMNVPFYENGLIKEDPEDEHNVQQIFDFIFESKNRLMKLKSNQRPSTCNLNMTASRTVTVDYPSYPEILKTEVSSEDKPATNILGEQYVNSLNDAQVVYRTVNVPLGGVVNIPPGYKYCIQGFFVKTRSHTYEFVNYYPYTQYYGISAETNELEMLPNPIQFLNDEFSRIYVNTMDLISSGDISVEPPEGVPCINITNTVPVETRSEESEESAPL